MLVTTCRHCGSQFRVTPEQLNLRQGQVRCGQCQEVFSGFEALKRIPDEEVVEQRVHAEATVEKSLELPESPAATPLEPAEMQDLAVLPHVPDALDLRGAPRGNEADAASPGKISQRPEPSSRRAAAVLADPYEIEPPARPSRAWAFAAALLALLLAMQLAYAFRAPLAQQYPVLRPYLESVCARVHCTVPWVNDEAALKLEDSELLEVPGKPGQIALQARIRNLSTSAQEFPHLELTLTDVSGQTAVRRVLRPTDYLGRPPATGEVMAAGSEALLSVRLETGSILATGYELLLFYP